MVAGVGHAGAAAVGLGPLADALRDRAAAGRPVLGICVGMQLFFERERGGRHRPRAPPRAGAAAAGENGAAHGLEHACRAPSAPRCSAGVDGADVYFAHSYAAEPEDDVTTAVVDHDGSIVASVESGPLAGVQFHPERSGAAGARVLENALRWSRSA